LYPEAEDLNFCQFSQDDFLKVTEQLVQLGFKPTQSQMAVEYLLKPSPFTYHLLGTLTPLEACIEYLVLHVPECDLPSRFLPTINSSNPFITSTHSGTDDLKQRWIEDKAIKEAGWPAHVVRHCTSDPRFLRSWELLILALDKRLIGEDVEELFSTEPVTSHQSYSINPDEAEALGATYPDSTTLVMPLFSAPIKLHILLPLDHCYPGTDHPPIFLTSSSVSAYIRLHLVSRLLHAMKASDFIEPGEGFLMASMRLLEGEWAAIEDNGPPDVSTVLQHLVPRTSELSGMSPISPALDSSRFSYTRKNSAGYRRDPRSDGDIKSEFEAMRVSAKYGEIFAARSRLPAFSAKDEFLGKLDKNRVIVVVGETGN
jgi:ATP-dependent RNA helicase DHX57